MFANVVFQTDDSQAAASPRHHLGPMMANYDFNMICTSVYDDFLEKRYLRSGEKRKRSTSGHARRKHPSTAGHLIGIVPQCTFSIRGNQLGNYRSQREHGSHSR